MRILRAGILLILTAVLAISFTPAYAGSPVVRAVLFYSPTCGHCHTVMTKVLPPLQDTYGEQLQILAIDVTDESGQSLYQNALTAFQVPDERLGVPMLILGANVLVGSIEIPAQLPGLIERSLAAGGAGWPEIPGLERQIRAATGSSESRPGRLQQMQARFFQDRLANSIALVVLAGLVLSLVASGIAIIRPTEPRPSNGPVWAAILLAASGLVIAVYLSFIEITHRQAICGPVGDCNTVQSSPYAFLFGFLPVGLLGAGGYGALLVLLAVHRFGPPGWRNQAGLGSWAAALTGTLFSVYLTFLEPFVIGATCAWCVTSAIIMGLILTLTTPYARFALEEWRSQAAKQAA